MDNTNDKTVPVEEAAAQVKVVAIRLALMHIAYARTLVAELGTEKAKNIILQAMMEYGRLVGERNQAGKQDLPFYGLHQKTSYQGKEFIDIREMPHTETEPTDWDQLKVYGCVLSEIFKEYDEEELGRLYCFVDAAKSMAADPSQKLIHTACEVCGDDYCAFRSLPATDEERALFANKDPNWKEVDPILTQDNETETESS